jgi:hypothetical protein
MKDDLFNRVGWTIVAILFVVFIIFAAYRTLHTNVVEGKVVNLWVQVESNYATIELPDGNRLAIGLFPLHYGVIQIGQMCRFDVDFRGIAQSVQCQPFNPSR